MLMVLVNLNTNLDTDWYLALNLEIGETYFIEEVIKINGSIWYCHIQGSPKQYWLTIRCFEHLVLKIPN